MPTHSTDPHHSIRNELSAFLRGDQAHASLDAAVKNMPAALLDKKPAGSPHNSWQMLEHIRITLHDLLEFCTNPHYEAPRWPEGYWPAEEIPKSATAWNHCVAGIHTDLKAFDKLIQDPKTDLTEKIPWGDGQTILREILLAGDHTSYHLGQLILLRKQLDAWKD
ncbi:MAG TPA: DinB family protein [Acidobacteriaceae bacterium]|nr:DinB family protein [Acidobacteriaceae bacterium]